MKHHGSTCGIAFFLALIVTSLSRAQELKIRTPYRIHPGDQVEVRFRLTPEYNQTVAVRPDGFIDLSIAGSVRVADLEISAAEAAIASRASRRLKDPEVSISLVDFQKPYFVVAGEVARPGKYDLRETTTALQGVLISGGPNADGKISQVILYRRINGDHAQVKVLNLKGIKKVEQLEHDVLLEPGDMLYVSRTRVASMADIMRIGTSLGLYVSAFAAVP
jgi:polysaccharide export outer membrane protein